MMVMDYDPSSGRLTYKGQTVSTLPPGFTGSSYASASTSVRMVITLWIKQVIDTIVTFDVNPDGWLLNPRWTWTRGLSARTGC